MVRSRPTVLVIMLALIIVGVSPALAAAKDEPAPGKKEPAEQPDIFKFRLDLTIWTIIVFGALLLVLRKYAWNPMLSGLQQREHAIHTAQEEAKRHREEAQRLRDEVQKRLDATTAEVQAMLDKSRREGQQLKDDLVNQAHAVNQADRDRMLREIETARDQAVQELWNQTAQLATLISAKAIRRQLSPDDHRRLVDEALAELGPAGKRRKETNV